MHVLTLASISILAGITVLALSAPGRAVAPRVSKPNIVFILTDDEDVRIHAFMPKTRALLEDRGATFTNFFVTYSLCCPSRASIYRGQYPHNTQILGNRPPAGGFERFRDLGHERSTVATWLQGAGYRTVFAGKYLNGYGESGSETHVPPGWTEWYAGVRGRPYANFGYTLNENGKLVAYGNQAHDYLVDVIARKGVEAIRRAAQAGQPLFLHLSTYTPHAPATPAPRHAALFAGASLPRPPSFNEADISDKPAFRRARPLLTGAQIEEMEALYRRRLRSLQAVDDLVEAVVQALQQVAQLDATWFVYTSDNGFHMGEHRLPSGKATAYEEDIRVPFIVRGPGVSPGRRVEHLALNIDIAPTLAEIAGARAPAFVDGRSLLSLLRTGADAWRQAFLIEFRTEAQAPRAVTYAAVRTTGWTYVEWSGGQRELYDLWADPFQLQNRVESADVALVRALASRLSGLARCVAEECRRVEGAVLGAP